MSKPSDRDLAFALGIRPEQVHQLRKRGMPVATIARAREWYATYGMASRGAVSKRKGH